MNINRTHVWSEIVADDAREMTFSIEIFDSFFFFFCFHKCEIQQRNECVMELIRIIWNVVNISFDSSRSIVDYMCQRSANRPFVLMRNWNLRLKFSVVRFGLVQTHWRHAIFVWRRSSFSWWTVCVVLPSVTSPKWKASRHNLTIELPHTCECVRWRLSDLPSLIQRCVHISRLGRRMGIFFKEFSI